MASKVPAPYIWPFAGWLGQDGEWSVFSLSVGTPPQTFQVVPSTSSFETWIPVAEGCSWIASQMPRCAQSRGVTDPGMSALGFLTNESSSWQQLGLYQLNTEKYLFGPNENGLYGMDKLTIGTESQSLNIGIQTIAGIATQDFWLGSVGLTDMDPVFWGSEISNSLLDTLVKNQSIPSISYGFAAGAAYSEYAGKPGVMLIKIEPMKGSLVLGGYDASAVGAESISYNIGSGMNLVVNLAGIVATNTLTGTTALLASANGLTMEVDSAVSQLWLPQNVCNSFAQAFGLLYDNKTNLYLVNSTVHDKLKQLAPELTFSLALDAASVTKTNIVFPYSAFDLTIGLPTYNETYLYFPIRRAANESQYVLGRTFLQEAYLIVDWERKNFTLGQDKRQNDTSPDIVAILSTNSTSDGEASHQLSTPVLVGASAGSAAAVLIAIAIFCWRWSFLRKRKAVAIEVEQQVSEERIAEKLGSPLFELGSDAPTTEAMSSPLYELDEIDSKVPALIMSTSVYELPGDTFSQELSARPRPCSIAKS